MIIDNQNINNITSLNYQSVGPYTDISKENRILDIKIKSGLMSYYLGQTFYSLNEPGSMGNTGNVLSGRMSFGLEIPDTYDADTNPYGTKINYDESFLYPSGTAFIIESISVVDGVGGITDTIELPAEVFFYTPPSDPNWAGNFESDGTIREGYEFLSLHVDDMNYFTELTDIFGEQPEFYQNNTSFNRGNIVNLRAVNVYSETIGSVHQPWQGRDIIDNVENDNRVSLGTYTENNRDYWVSNTYDSLVNESQFKDDKLHIAVNQSILADTVPYSEIFGDKEFVKAEKQSFSIDAFPYTIDDDKTYPLFFYYDELLHKNEFEATSEGKVHLKITRREVGRPDGLLFNPFLDRPVIEDVFFTEEVEEEVVVDEEEEEVVDVPTYTLSLQVDGHYEGIHNPYGFIRAPGDTGNGEYVPRQIEYEEEHGYVLLEAVPLSEEFLFDGWIGDVDEEFQNDEEINILMDGDKSITAKFIALNLDSGGNPIPTLTSPEHTPIDLDNMWFGEAGDTRPIVPNAIQTVDVQNLDVPWNFNVRYIHDVENLPDPFTIPWNWSVHAVWPNHNEGVWEDTMLGYQEYVSGVSDQLQDGPRTITGGDTSQSQNGNVYRLTNWEWGLNNIINSTQPTTIYYYITVNDQATGQMIRSTLGEIINLWADYGYDSTGGTDTTGGSEGDTSGSEDTGEETLVFPSDEYAATGQTPNLYDTFGPDSNGNTWMYTWLTNEQAGNDNVMTGYADMLTSPPEYGWILYNPTPG